MKRIYALILCATLIAPQAALAASLIATSVLDWGSFAYSTTPGLTLAFSDDSFGGIFGPDVGEFGDLEANLTISGPAGLSPVGLVASVTDGSATGSVYSDGTDLPDSVAGPSGIVMTEAIATGPTVAPTDFINTVIYRMLEVTATGTGTASFTLPYDLSISMSDTAAARAQAEAFLGVSSIISVIPTAFSFAGEQAALVSFSDGTDKTDILAGVLTFEIDLVDGEVIQLGSGARTDVRNFDPVPLPGALWLMIGGCGALLGLRRRATT